MTFNLGNLSRPTFEMLDLLPYPSPKNPVLVRGEGVKLPNMRKLLEITLKSGAKQLWIIQK